MRRCGFLLITALAAALLTGCIHAGPVLVPEVVYATPTPTPTPQPTPTPAPTATPVPTPRPGYDAMGNFIAGEAHYWRYLLFKDIFVYEQAEDTFLSGFIINEYSEPLKAELDVCFYENDEEVARGEIRMGDGTSDVLTLAPGENRIWAQINTDMTLTSLKLEFVDTAENRLKPE